MPAVPALRPVVSGILAMVVTLTGCTAAETGSPDGDPGAVPSGRLAEESVAPQASERDGVAEALRPAYDGQPVRPRTPGQAAEMVYVAQRVIRSTDPPARLLEAAGHSEQLAVREIAVRSGWLPKVLRALPAAMRWQTRANVESRREFRSMHGRSRDSLHRHLPAWRIVEPAAPGVLMRSYREAERRYGIGWEYLAAINLVETAFGRIRGTSVAGAQGPMQFIPGTWDMYGEGGDVNDAHDAILAAARLLKANGFAPTRAMRCGATTTTAPTFAA